MITFIVIAVALILVVYGIVTSSNNKTQAVIYPQAPVKTVPVQVTYQSATLPKPAAKQPVKTVVVKKVVKPTPKKSR